MLKAGGGTIVVTASNATPPRLRPPIPRASALVGLVQAALDYAQQASA